ncbi:MAG: NINE protein [Candidatus Diapherotrites archaeon]
MVSKNNKSEEKQDEEKQSESGLPDSKAKYCQDCGKKISQNAAICPNCGVNQPGAESTEKKSRTVAVILSIFIPGTGQMYAGQFGLGLLILCTSWLVIPWLYGIYNAATRKDLK